MDLTACEKRLSLIPYLPCHVEQYNAWLQDSDIAHLTGMDEFPTLEEDMEMCQKWQEDSDKITFLIKDSAETQNIDGIVGDVNMFYDEESKQVEFNVMVAEKRARRCSFAKNSILLAGDMV
eukprot:TRINITY_DN5129_c0_g1_i2.p1 TRINITY_DN5129_c0_g1~~TRINITY_DN5129_c0_g1_i2.p1  ORF type:complete len:121 (+),score=25.17 TRINITY_DN5129_c0_g1_i2:108-470(+)